MVTPRFYPDTGGIQTHVREVSERMLARGLDVRVLTTDATGRLPERETVAGIDVHRVPAWPRHRDYYLAPGIWPSIRKEPWDVVHCQGVHTLVAPMAMVAARSAGLPYIVSFHTGGHSTGLRHRLRGLQWRALRPLLSRACRLVAVSRFEAELFGRTLRPTRGRLVLVPNGVTLLEGADSDMTTGDGAPTILSIGRLERYKGHHRLIAAMPDVLRDIPDARAQILGSGPYEGALRSLADRLGIAHRVAISSVPAGERATMARHIGSASLVVLLSDYEAHPVALLEAASAGRPVLVARTSGLTELVDAGLAAGVDADASPAATAAAIVAAIRAPVGAPAPDLPTWDQTTDSLLELYEACLPRGS